MAALCQMLTTAGRGEVAEAVQAQLPPFPLAAGALSGLRQAAEAAGRGDFSPLWAGQNTRACRNVPAADVVRELAAGLSPTVPRPSLEPRP